MMRVYNFLFNLNIAGRPYHFLSFCFFCFVLFACLVFFFSMGINPEIV